MSRSISIWFSKNEKDIDIEVDNQDLLGTQNSSKIFWSIRKLRNLGLKELTQLGRIDPVGFRGWQELKLLENEIEILEKNIEQIDFNIVAKERWIGNLRYCFDTLIKIAPKDSTPHFIIG